MAAGKRRFGRVRQLPSGRYRARYRGPDGIDHPADHTFATKGDAERWLVDKEAEIRRGDWLNPDFGSVFLGDYARAWVAERANLRPKTAQLYEGLVRLHLVPLLGMMPIRDIREGTVRRWRKSLLDSGTGPVTVAKAYRLLKAILTTAVDDGLIRRNPCRIKGAGQEHSAERPVLTIRQVFALADTFDDRYRVPVLLAVFCSLRYGELAALQRADIDTTAGILTVRRSVTELARGPLVTGPTKSAAGRRTLTIPDFLLTDVKAHLDEFVAAGPDALILTGVKGAQLRRSNFTRLWGKATESSGLTGFHFHDLRHTGNTFASEAGAGLRELMDRMGHSSTRAALMYQHRTSARDKKIAAAISKLARAERPRSGTQRARRDQNGK